MDDTPATDCETVYVGKAASGYTIIKAVLTPETTAAELRSGFMTWTVGSGLPGANQLERKKAKTAPSTTHFKAIMPGPTPPPTTEKTVTVVVVAVDLAAQGVSEANEETIGKFVGVRSTFDLTLAVDPDAALPDAHYVKLT